MTTLNKIQENIVDAADYKNGERYVLFKKGMVVVARWHTFCLKVREQRRRAL